MQQLEWDVLTITEETDKLYDRIVAKGGRDKLTLTRERIIESRGWQSSLYLTKDNFGRSLTELGCFYVPKVMQPGPAFVFPIIDIDRTCQYAQTKPLKGSVLGGKSKYRFIGSDPVGPTWLGNTDETIQTVVSTGQVILVEGPFDLLACRVAAYQSGPIARSRIEALALGIMHQCFSVRLVRGSPLRQTAPCKSSDSLVVLAGRRTKGTLALARAGTVRNIPESVPKIAAMLIYSS